MMHKYIKESKTYFSEKKINEAGDFFNSNYVIYVKLIDGSYKPLWKLLEGKVADDKFYFYEK